MRDFHRETEPDSHPNVGRTREGPEGMAVPEFSMAIH